MVLGNGNGGKLLHGLNLNSLIIIASFLAAFVGQWRLANYQIQEISNRLEKTTIEFQSSVVRVEALDKLVGIMTQEMAIIPSNRARIEALERLTTELSTNLKNITDALNYLRDNMMRRSAPAPRQ